MLIKILVKSNMAMVQLILNFIRKDFSAFRSQHSSLMMRPGGRSYMNNYILHQGHTGLCPVPDRIYMPLVPELYCFRVFCPCVRASVHLYVHHEMLTVFRPSLVMNPMRYGPRI